MSLILARANGQAFRMTWPGGARVEITMKLRQGSHLMRSRAVSYQIRLNDSIQIVINERGDEKILPPTEKRSAVGKISGFVTKLKPDQRITFWHAGRPATVYFEWRNRSAGIVHIEAPKAVVVFRNELIQEGRDGETPAA